MQKNFANLPQAHESTPDPMVTSTITIALTTTAQSRQHSPHQYASAELGPRSALRPEEKQLLP